MSHAGPFAATQALLRPVASPRRAARGTCGTGRSPGSARGVPAPRASLAPCRRRRGRQRRGTCRAGRRGMRDQGGAGCHGRSTWEEGRGCWPRQQLTDGGQRNNGRPGARRAPDGPPAARQDRMLGCSSPPRRPGLPPPGEHRPWRRRCCRCCAHVFGTPLRTARLQQDRERREVKQVAQVWLKPPGRRWPRAIAELRGSRWAARTGRERPAR